jgi:hypothetical protein
MANPWAFKNQRLTTMVGMMFMELLPRPAITP